MLVDEKIESVPVIPPPILQDLPKVLLSNLITPFLPLRDKASFSLVNREFSKVRLGGECLDLRSLKVGLKQLYAILSRFFQVRHLALPSELKYQLRDQDLDEILKGLPKLESLCLDGCEKITDRGLMSLRHCPELKELHLYHCSRLSGNALKFLQFCPHLKKLSYSTDCVKPTLGDPPISFEHLHYCPDLEELNLKHFGIAPSQLNLLTHKKNLHSLRFQSVLLEDPASWSFLNHLPLLRHLGLRDCAVGDRAIAQFRPCLERINSLDLTGCSSISPAGLRILESAKNLRELDITNCRFPIYGIGYLIHDSDLSRLRKALPELKIQAEY